VFYEGDEIPLYENRLRVRRYYVIQGLKGVVQYVYSVASRLIQGLKGVVLPYLISDLYIFRVFITNQKNVNWTPK